MKKESKKIINSFKYAISGIKLAFKEERNMKIHFLAMTLVIILGIILKITNLEWIICIILFGLVISAELLNTAIETLTNVVMPEKNEKAKITKDVAAGAVLVMAIVSAIIGIIIFIPRILVIL